MAWAELIRNGDGKGKYRGRYRDAANKKQTVAGGPFTQKAEAVRKAGAKEDEQRQAGAISVNAGRIRFGDWWEQLIDSHPIEKSTERKYRTTARLHILPYWENTPLEEIDLMGGNRWVKVLQASPQEKTLWRVKKDWDITEVRTPWTIRLAVQIFTMSMNAATPPHARRLPLNPIKGLKWPDLPPSPERFLTEVEVEAITHFMNPLDRLIVWTAVTCGLRIGELAGLHASRVDLERGVIRVQEQFDEYSSVIKPCPKDKDKRHVPIPGDALAMLRRHIQSLPRLDVCGTPHAVGKCPGGALVFRGPRGGELRGITWNRRNFKSAVKLAGVEGRVRPHDMRHTYASWLLQEGVSLAEVARMMGHSDTEVTKRYAHLAPDGYDKVREALDRRLSRGAAAGASLRVVKGREGASGSAEDVASPAETA